MQPLMVRFWSSVLLGAAEYKGNPMQKHVELSRQVPFHMDHFERWLKQWRVTIDPLFEEFNVVSLKRNDWTDVGIGIHQTPVIYVG